MMFRKRVFRNFVSILLSFPKMEQLLKVQGVGFDFPQINQELRS